MLLEQKDIEIDGKQFVISKFPAMAGYEIVTQFPISAVPKLGDFATHKELIYKIMCYVGVKIEGNPAALALTTEGLINNHAGNWETLSKLIMAMMEYNCTFLASGKISGFLDSIMESLPTFLSKILTSSQAQLSVKDTPRSKSSKKITP